jgi:hypothetical protein
MRAGTVTFLLGFFGAADAQDFFGAAERERAFFRNKVSLSAPPSRALKDTLFLKKVIGNFFSSDFFFQKKFQIIFYFPPNTDHRESGVATFSRFGRR